MVPAREGDRLLLRLVADARGRDGDRIKELLTTGDVHLALAQVLAGFPGMWATGPQVIVQRMRDVRMHNAVAVTIGNRYSGTDERDCHLSAHNLSDALRSLGMRTEAPWIDQPGGLPMLDRLKQVINDQVQPTDDGFVFCFAGHGRATNLQGQDGVFTAYQAIVDVIAAAPKLQGKPKVVIFDCCQVVVAGEPRDQLSLPKEMILARSTGLGTVAFEQANVGGIYSKRFANALRSHAKAHTLEDLIKLTQAAVHGLSTPAPQ
eukprot:2894451-Prymnesium_polylepis.1